MTTNAGARELAGRSIGFVSSKKGKNQTDINKLSAPEFSNRLDAIASFSSLDHAATELVVVKLIRELEVQLAEKRVTIRITSQARTYLAKKGYDPDYGARPLRRLTIKEISDSLTEEILFGSLVRGGEVMVDAQDDGLSFIYSREDK
jgi:ATP-dependent Clp protease ATP-binding subunit ClpA